MWPFKKKEGGGFSYINPEVLNRRAIIIFGLEAAAFLIIIVVVIGVLQYLRIISIEELFWGGNDGNKIGKVAPSKPKKAISQGISYSMPGENSRNDSKNEKESENSTKSNKKEPNQFKRHYIKKNPSDEQKKY